MGPPWGTRSGVAHRGAPDQSVCSESAPVKRHPGNVSGLNAQQGFTFSHPQAHFPPETVWAEPAEPLRRAACGARLRLTRAPRLLPRWAARSF